MPSAIPTTNDTITKFTNCKLVKGDELVEQDLWVSTGSGKIVRSQEAFYGDHAVPDKTIDLGGRIVSPGLIDVQLNGAFGFNFSTIPTSPSLSPPPSQLPSFAPLSLPPLGPSSKPATSSTSMGSGASRNPSPQPHPQAQVG